MRVAAVALLLASGVPACDRGGVDPRTAPPSPIDAALLDTGLSMADALLEQPLLGVLAAADGGSRAGTSSCDETCIADSLRGRAYVRDERRGVWVADSTREAPSSEGVRFVLGPTAANPSAELVAVVDVEDRSSEWERRSYAIMRSADGLVGLRFIHNSTGEPNRPGYENILSVDLAAGDRSLYGQTTELLFASTAGIPAQRLSQTWGLPAAMIHVETDVVAHQSAGDSTYARAYLGDRLMQSVNRHVPDPVRGGYAPGDTTLLYLDDWRPYAIVIAPARVVRPGGAAVPEAERSALLRLESTRRRVVTLFALPAIVEGWLAELTLPGA